MNITEEDFALKAEILNIKPDLYGTISTQERQTFVVYVCPACNHEHVLRFKRFDMSPKMYKTCECGTELLFKITSFLQGIRS